MVLITIVFVKESIRIIYLKQKLIIRIGLNDYRTPEI